MAYLELEEAFPYADIHFLVFVFYLLVDEMVWP